MYHMSRTVAVNDDPAQPRLTRGDVWRGLLLKADNALPFVPQMSRCDVLERGDNWLVRDITFRGEDARERVSLFPEQRVHFERLQGRTLGTIDNEIVEDEHGQLQLRFGFALQAEGIPPGSDQENAHFGATESAYLNAVNATLEAIRRVVREQGSINGAGRNPGMANSEWIHAYFRTVDSMDMEAYLALHTDDVRFRFGNQPMTTGKEPIREGLSQLWGSIGGLRHEIVRTWDTGDTGVSEAVTVYTRKDGSEIGLPVTTILRRRGELVEDIRIYMDLAPLFAPAAAEPEPELATAGAP
jgi:ketosteroid isomerase-like protein